VKDGRFQPSPLAASLEKLRSPEQLVITNDKYWPQAMRTVGNALANP